MLHIALLASGFLSYSQLRRHKKKRLEKKKQARQHKLLASQNAKQIEREEKARAEKSVIEKDFAISSLALGLSGVGVFLYTPFLVPAMGIYAYLSRPILEKAYRAIKQREKDIHIVYGIALPGILISGYPLTGALNYWLYAFSQKILLNAKENKRQRVPVDLVQLPEHAWLLKDGVEISTPLADLSVGDHLFVRAGETLIADGVITQTVGEVLIEDYQLSASHELKVLKSGDRVLAGQQVIAGDLYMQIKKPTAQSRLMRLHQALQKSNSQDLARPLKGEALADDIVLPTLAISALAVPVAGVAGMLAILESCVGEAMRITIPMHTLKFLQKAFDEGLLIKDGRVFEDLTDSHYLLLDFTDLDTEQAQSLYAQLPALSAEKLHLHALFFPEQVIESELLHVHRVTASSDKQAQLKRLSKKYHKIAYIGTDLNCLRHAPVSVCLHNQALIACHAAKVIILKADFSALMPLFALRSQLKNKLDVGTALSIIPGATVISGVFFAHLGVASSFMVYYSGLLAGMGHANRPVKIENQAPSTDKP